MTYQSRHRGIDWRQRHGERLESCYIDAMILAEELIAENDLLHTTIKVFVTLRYKDKAISVQKAENKRLERTVKAKTALLTAYRTGGQPPEWALDWLAKEKP